MGLGFAAKPQKLRSSERSCGTGGENTVSFLRLKAEDALNPEFPRLLEQPNLDMPSQLPKHPETCEGPKAVGSLIVVAQVPTLRRGFGCTRKELGEAIGRCSSLDTAQLLEVIDFVLGLCLAWGECVWPFKFHEDTPC